MSFFQGNQFWNFGVLNAGNLNRKFIILYLNHILQESHFCHAIITMGKRGFHRQNLGSPHFPQTFPQISDEKRGVFKGFHRLFNSRWNERGLKHVDCGKSDRILQFVNRGDFFDKKRRQDVQKLRQNSGKTATVKSHIRVCCIFHSFVI